MSVSKCKRTVFLEVFGEIPSTVGRHLQEHREKTLGALCKEIQHTKMEIAKALSVLIHFEVVGFTNTEGRFKYFVREEYFYLADCPVYLEYLNRVCEKTEAAILCEMLVKKEVREKDVPEELRPQIKTLQSKGFIARIGKPKEIKIPKTSADTEEEGLRVALEKVRQCIVNQLLEETIEKHFTRSTKVVFGIVKSMHPLSVPLKTIVQQISLLKIQDLEIAGHTTLESAVNEHLQYLSGYGVLSSSFERYQANLSVCMSKLKVQCLQEYCDRYLEEKTSTVIAHLLSRRYIEDKFMQRHLLMDSAQCKKALFSLLREGLVSTQMVPRTAECMATKSFHFWHADESSVYSALQHKVWTRINACYLELRQCREKQGILTQSEYKHKTDSLYNALAHLHTIYFVIRL
ncbi:hypothetical protein NECID01_0239 [Nematocida sp. AWRm77]|nr:hypothetical protein NECID01_0239 [Nematocida sp. AWRm77]